jgi:hypothetical protein
MSWPKYHRFTVVQSHVGEQAGVHSCVKEINIIKYPGERYFD